MYKRAIELEISQNKFSTAGRHCREVAEMQERFEDWDDVGVLPPPAILSGLLTSPSPSFPLLRAIHRPSAITSRLLTALKQPMPSPLLWAPCPKLLTSQRVGGRITRRRSICSKQLRHRRCRARISRCSARITSTNPPSVR